MGRDTLTKEQIVQTAIELLDAEGLEGLSMRSLGEKLGSAATAVYWHVKSKDNLVLLAGDEVWNEVPLPDLNVADWRTAAETMAKDLHSMLVRHPWLVQGFGTHLFYGPGMARHDDHSLGLYEMAGFVGAEADQAMAIVFIYILGSALREASEATLRRRLRREGHNAEELIRETIARQTEIAMQFPNLRTRVESVDTDDYYSAPDKTFEIGLAAIFDGLERQLHLSRRDVARTNSDNNGWFA